MRGSKRAKRRIWSALTTAGLSVAVLIIPVSNANALIELPGFEVIPNSVVRGQQATIEAGYSTNIYVPNSPLYCPNPIDWIVTGPGGNQVAAGHIDPPLQDSVTGEILQTYSSTVTIPAMEPLGTYTLSEAPASDPCDPGQFGQLRDYSFDVVDPSTPPTPPTVVFLTPSLQAHADGQTATVTGSVTTGGNPAAGVHISFSTAGANPSAALTCAPTSCVTDDSGTITLTYSGTAVGEDTITAQLDGQQGDLTTATTKVDWTHGLAGYAFAALGDSYSSGEGMLSYDLETNLPTQPNMCHRSKYAYARQIAAARPALGDIGHVACSGAITDDFFRFNHSGNTDLNGVLEQPQFCSASAVIVACPVGNVPAVGPNTKTVTLTIGGNDAGFASVLESCIWTSIGPLKIGKPGRPNCSTNPAITGPLTRRVAALGGVGTNVASADGTPIHSYAQVLAAIHKAAPNAHVYLIGYPQLFDDPTLKDCNVGTGTFEGAANQIRISAIDAFYLDTMTILLNRAETNAAKAAGSWATYVDVTKRFQGHGLCDSLSWLNALNGSFTLPHTETVPPEDGHPTPAGEANGYLAALQATSIGN